MFDLTTIQLRNEHAVHNHFAKRVGLSEEKTIADTAHRIKYFAELLPSGPTPEASFVWQLNIHSVHSALDRFTGQ